MKEQQRHDVCDIGDSMRPVIGTESDGGRLHCGWLKNSDMIAVLPEYRDDGLMSRFCNSHAGAEDGSCTPARTFVELDLIKDALFLELLLSSTLDPLRLTPVPRITIRVKSKIGRKECILRPGVGVDATKYSVYSIVVKAFRGIPDQLSPLSTEEKAQSRR